MSLTGAAAADARCEGVYFAKQTAVTDVRLLENTVVEVDIRNDGAVPIVGYGLFYVFDTDFGLFTEDLPTFIVKREFYEGEVHTHRMRLADFDLEADQVKDFSAHVVSAVGLWPTDADRPPMLC